MAKSFLVCYYLDSSYEMGCQDITKPALREFGQVKVEWYPLHTFRTACKRVPLVFKPDASTCEHSTNKRIVGALLQLFLRVQSPSLQPINDYSCCITYFKVLTLFQVLKQDVRISPSPL